MHSGDFRRGNPFDSTRLAYKLDENKQICCVFCNFQKAFDDVPHRRLMEKLKQLYLHL